MLLKNNACWQDLLLLTPNADPASTKAGLRALPLQSSLRLLSRTQEAHHPLLALVAAAWLLPSCCSAAAHHIQHHVHPGSTYGRQPQQQIYRTPAAYYYAAAAAAAAAGGLLRMQRISIPGGALGGLGGSLLVQHCIEGAQLAFTWFPGSV
jgi:hypothetical protein